MSATPSILSFSGGELDPKFWGRVDLNKYGTALRQSRNGYPHLEGGWSNRQGSGYISTLKYGDTYDSILVPFEFSITQSYEIEMGRQYARFYMNQAQIATGSVTPYNGATAYVPGNIASSGGVNYICIANTTGNAPPNATYWYALTGNTVEIPTPYLDTDLRLLKWTQSADVLYLFHPSYPPATITRFGNTNWVYSVIQFGSSVSAPTGLLTNSGNGIAAPTNFAIVTNGSGASTQIFVAARNGTTEGAPSNILTINLGAQVSWTAVGGVTGYNIYAYTSGSWQRVDANNPTVTAPTVTYTVTVANATSVFPTFQPSSGFYAYAVTALDSAGRESLPSNQVSSTNTAILTWNAVAGAAKYNIYQRIANWGFVAQVDGGTTSYTLASNLVYDTSKGLPIIGNPFNSTNNYPGTGDFFQGCLVYARTNNSPQQFWFSRPGDYTNLNSSTTLTAGDSFSFVMVGGGRVNEIKRIIPMPIAGVLGTGGGIWSFGDASSQPVSATNPPNMHFVDQRWGMNDMKPIGIGNKILWWDNSSRRARDLYYQVQAFSNQGNEISIWARHIWKDYQAVSWAFNAYPDSICWIVRSDGQMAGLSYQREEGMTDFVAWHRHDTQGYYKDVSSINNPDGTQDVYQIVRRKINGSWTRYIECFKQRYFSDIRKAWFVDAGIQYSNTRAITAISQANPCQVTSANHGLANGTIIRIGDVVGMDQLYKQTITRNIAGKVTTLFGESNRYFKVANTATNTFTLVDMYGNAVDSTAYNAYESGGTIYVCTSSFSGASHLANMAVTVLADGKVVPGITVASDGTFSIPYAAGVVTAGLGYDAEMIPMSPEYQTQKGTVQDKKRQIKDVFVSFQNTSGLYCGWGPEDILQPVRSTQDQQWADPTLSLKTMQNAVVSLNPNEDVHEATLYFTGTRGLPFTILRAIPSIQEGIKS